MSFAIFAAVAGCSASDTEIIGRLDVPSPPVLLADVTLASVGAIDGSVLVGHAEPALDAGDAWGPRVSDVSVRWVAPDGTRGPSETLGRVARPWETHWVRDGDALFGGALYGATTPSPEPPDQRHVVVLWRLPASSTATCNTSPALPAVVDPMQPTVSYTGVHTTLDGRLPTAASTRGARVYLHALPETCVPPYDSGLSRVLAVGISACEPTAEFSLWTPACERAEIDAWVDALWRSPSQAATSASSTARRWPSAPRSAGSGSAAASSRSACRSGSGASRRSRRGSAGSLAASPSGPIE